MGKSYKSHSFFNGLKFSCQNAVKENRWKIIITLAFVLVAICAGIFVAVKYNNAYNLCQLQEISISDFYSGFAASSSAFLSRSLSLTINAVILVCLSFSPFLFPLALVLFVYRGYLFGLNFALIFIFYGIGSAVTAVIVILPCQLCILSVLVMFYIIFQKINSNCKKYGGAECSRLLFVVFFIVLLLVINLAETLLLLVLNGKVIMVI